ncbi:MAG TPA: exo-beta-N-acetylmuramidase NamZ domain-containing protein [Candidatus Acidoferrum sp.]|nr:exo-beta-N-acetylmuramidase NamZ domain-containing protein [Candidatus Acidoferrum sp.]
MSRGHGAVPAAVIVGIVLLAIAVRPAACSGQPFDFSGVEAAATDAVASGEIPGVVVFVGRGDEVLLHRAWGSRAVVPHPLPMLPDTIFDVASLTKPFGTTLAVMSLVERGKIILDAPLSRYLPEFRAASFSRVTIRRILTHTAGFPPIPGNGALASGFPKAAKLLAAKAPDYAPGTVFQYSDTGFILLAEVVRRVSDEPIDRYLQRSVFDPLQLKDTTYHPRDAVVARVAPTEFADGALLQGRVHDPRARLLGGAAGHAGMFSTAADLARLCRMLLKGGALDGRRVLRAETVRTMWTPSPEGDGSRALGWDISSGYARTMAPFFPRGSVGHVGFTGTAAWLDPATRTYMIILTNRVHPNGGGVARIRDLRHRVAAAVGATLFGRGASPTAGGSASTSTGADTAAEGSSTSPAPVSGRVLSGLDTMVRQKFAMFIGKAVGLVTNQTGVDAQGRRAIDLIAAAAPAVRLQAIFSPEHGVTGVANADVPHGRDLATGRPIWSLYGPTRRPTLEMMRGVTLIVFDIQDVGVRYYTYLTTLVYVLEEAGRLGIPVVVLDRPNPITGRVVEGPLMDADLGSFTGPYTIPVRTGMTIGEFARMVAEERKLPLALTVVPLTGWDRSTWYDETGLPWVNPSPNIRSVTQALLYSGIGLLEATNISVGRGTETPFEVIGAPWMEGERVVAALDRLNLAGVKFEPVRFTPTGDIYARIACGGIRFVVTDREAIRPVTVALAVADTLAKVHRAEWRPEHIQNLLVNRSTMWALLRREPLPRVLAWAEVDRSSFLNRRASYLIYR